MKSKWITPVLALVALVAFSLSAHAQTPTCANVVWSAAAKERIPEVEKHCQEVVDRDGTWYARIHAKVVRQNPASTTVQFQNPDGTWSKIERVHPPEDFRAQIAGKDVKIADLNPGQEVNVYVRDQGNFTIPAAAAATSAPAPAPAAAPAPAPAAAPAPQPEPRPAALPKTAGNANWLALIGTLLVLLSAGLYVRRQI
jgi:LPXTG-motif cell wall-anchored protein